MPDEQHIDAEEQVPEVEAPTAEPQKGGNREAAERRRQLRETEAERDLLRGRVERMQTAEVERIVADRLTSPSDFWLSAKRDDLLTEDGDVDPAKVGAAVDSLLADRPHWAKPRIVTDFDAGARGGEVEDPPSFGEAFKRTGRASG
ncbi:MAG: hypothetical protein J7513_13245 [Solirubrobacteraceae bacterium]|nr:hypothetical protein [Solirubrobacteraceae bacterium]